MSDDERGTEFVHPRSRHDATIYLAEADPAWAEQYAQQATLIRRSLADPTATLEHVGSTSVPGMGDL